MRVVIRGGRGVALLCSALLMAGCGATGASPTEALPSASAAAASVEPSVPGPFKVGSMVWDTGNPFYSFFIQGQKDAAAECNIELDVQNGQSQLETQIAHVQQFIVESKDLILVTPGDAEGIVPVLKTANLAGIPIIAANNPVGEGPDLVTYVGSSNYNFGLEQAKMLVEAIGDEGNVGYILGALGTGARIDREKAFEDYLSNYPDIHIVEKQTANWDFQQALSLTQDWLNKHPEGTLDAIVDQGPEGVTGAQAAAQIGRTDVKFILGNLPETVKKAIEDGIVYGDVTEDPYAQGVEAVNQACLWLTGQKDKVVAPNDFTPFVIVTKENVDQVPAKM